MTARETTLLRGKPVADGVYAKLEPRIAALADRGVVPGLAAILVGENPASQVYVRSKSKAFARLGLMAETFALPSDTSASDLGALIDRLNGDDRFHGLLVQLPLPAHLAADRLLDRVTPDKDVDGFHPYNLGLLMAGRPALIPCTPQGILELLQHYKIKTAGRHAVVAGRSMIVGKPLAALLSLKRPTGNATVTLCHTGTENLSAFTRQADLLIVATGVPGLISPDMVKPGVDIIDVGMNRVEDDSEKGYHLEGDVITGDMLGRANSITPVPGGVGLMTVAMLVSNTVLAAEISAGVAAGR
ncbi:MAG: bifunctional 5,10-methylenetetrahydrofolate dehydrogenase/5,10-methenyltetrahydrofolate cyclohydrolase [Candidatus Marinimicrobia bacterium]|nr:bifunctional 5,10-methylenetetrahydrofolate dehydrogenase/5,10-methenyltetrahydrofolate cyclohydrolase [Candidatus Neomarinimicrobiota bacterium]